MTEYVSSKLKQREAMRKTPVYYYDYKLKASHLLRGRFQTIVAHRLHFDARMFKNMFFVYAIVLV